VVAGHRRPEGWRPGHPRLPSRNKTWMPGTRLVLRPAFGRTRVARHDNREAALNLLGRLRARMRGRLVEVRIPGVVSIQPAGIAAALVPHPGIGTGDRLHDRRAWLAMRLVAPEGAFDVLAIHGVETPGKNRSVLD